MAVTKRFWHHSAAAIGTIRNRHEGPLAPTFRAPVVPLIPELASEVPQECANFAIGSPAHPREHHLEFTRRTRSLRPAPFFQESIWADANGRELETTPGEARAARHAAASGHAGRAA